MNKRPFFVEGTDIKYNGISLKYYDWEKKDLKNWKFGNENDTIAKCYCEIFNNIYEIGLTDGQLWKSEILSEEQRERGGL